MTAPGAAAAPSPLLAGLRAATAGAHDRIEALLRLDQPIALPRYGRVLRGFDGFLAGWEPRVLAALPTRLHDGFRARSRHAFLRRDLRALGLAPGLDTACAASASALALDGVPAAFGSLYVLEGSALGGRVIARHLAECHGLGPDHGAAYFNGWGADTGALWRAFRQSMDEEVGGREADREAACAAAVATFEALVQGFERDVGFPDVP